MKVEANYDEVICPNCVTQFRAIPVNVQSEIAALKALNAELLDAAEEAADALERLTAGDVELPVSCLEYMSGHREPVGIYDVEDIRDYGDRRAAAAVLAERERCAGIIGEAARKWWSTHCASNKHMETTRKAHDDLCGLQVAIRKGTT